VGANSQKSTDWITRSNAPQQPCPAAVTQLLQVQCSPNEHVPKLDDGETHLMAELYEKDMKGYTRYERTFKDIF
jgi:hypothetical protein